MGEHTMTICLSPQVTSHVPSYVPSQTLSQPVAPSTPTPLASRSASSHARQACTPPRVTRRNTYALRIRGDRMRDCNLFDGDVIIIHLWPEDAAMPEVFLHNCDIQVLGMVMGVAHHATETRHH